MDKIESLINEIQRQKDKKNRVLKIVIRLANKLNGSKKIELHGDKEVRYVGYTQEEITKIMEILRRF